MTQTVEKRDRFPVRVRYSRASREDETAVKRLLIPAGKGGPLIPLEAIAAVQIVEGPAVIKSEDGRLLNYVTLNVRGRDAVGFVEEAKRVVAQKVKLPEGVHVEWAGEFEHQERAAQDAQNRLPDRDRVDLF